MLPVSGAEQLIASLPMIERPDELGQRRVLEVGQPGTRGRRGS